jgi:hypothetical protein
MYTVIFHMLLPFCPCPVGLSVVVETALLLGSHHIDRLHKILVHDDRSFPGRGGRVIWRERRRREAKRGDEDRERQKGRESESERESERDREQELHIREERREAIRVRNGRSEVDRRVRSQNDSHPCRITFGQ